MLTGTPDLPDIRPNLVIDYSRCDDVAVSIDDDKHVVDIVRYAAGKPTESLELLSLPELLLRVDPMRAPSRRQRAGSRNA